MNRLTIIGEHGGRVNRPFRLLGNDYSKGDVIPGSVLSDVPQRNLRALMNATKITFYEDKSEMVKEKRQVSTNKLTRKKVVKKVPIKRSVAAPKKGGKYSFLDEVGNKFIGTITKNFTKTKESAIYVESADDEFVIAWTKLKREEN